MIREFIIIAFYFVIGYIVAINFKHSLNTLHRYFNPSSDFKKAYHYLVFKPIMILFLFFIILVGLLSNLYFISNEYNNTKNKIEQLEDQQMNQIFIIGNGDNTELK